MAIFAGRISHRGASARERLSGHWLSRPSFEVASILASVARWILSLSHPSFPQGALRGVQSNDWPCGQDAQPEPVSHRRRILRHEARGQGYWVLTAGLVPCSREA
jgi:hypothetical protein